MRIHKEPSRCRNVSLVFRKCLLVLRTTAKGGASRYPFLIGSAFKIGQKSIDRSFEFDRTAWVGVWTINLLQNLDGSRDFT